MDKERIYDAIRRNSYEVLPDIEDNYISDDDNLQDLGANSIDRVEIINLTLEDLQLEIPRVGLAKTTNIKELVDAIYDESNS